MSSRKTLRWGLLLPTILMSVSAAGAFQVSGRVLDPSGLPAAGVDVDFIDRATGTNLPLTGDVTDAGGLFAVDVPAGGYRMRYKPPAGQPWAALQEQTIWIEGDEVRPDVQLEAGWEISGTLLDHLGAPVDNGDVDVTDTRTRQSIYLLHDGTDATGAFSVLVPCGTFDVVLEPPQGHPDAATRREDVEVPCAGVSLGNVSLVAGETISGLVTERVSGFPVADADLDAVDESTGESVPTPNDNTDAAGFYEIRVPVGTYSVDVEAPAGHRALPAEETGVVVASPTIQDFLLETGVLLSGTVTSVADGSVIEGVDLNAGDSVTGVRANLGADNTDYAGAYVVALPPGTYDIDYRPPRGSPYLTLRLTGEPVPGDTVRDVQLDSGFRLTGRVLSSVDGSPIAGVDLDLLHPVDGWTYLPFDETDADGVFVLTVAPSAGYVLVAQPADTWVLRRIEPVDVLSDWTDLGDILLDPGVELFGRVLSATNRVPLTDIDLDFVHADLGTVAATDDNTDDTGTFRVWLPAGLYDVQVTPDPALPYAPAVVQDVNLAFPGPVDLGDILLQDGVLVTGTVVAAGSGAPLQDVDLDLEDAAQGPVFLDGDNTAADGTFAIRAAAGSYLLELTPPAGSLYLPLRLDVKLTMPATDLGVLELQPAAELIGRVLRASDQTPVSGVDLDVDDPDSGRIYTPGDNTASDGTFSVLVPVRPDLRVSFDPPFAEKLAGAVRDPVNAVPPVTDLGDILLPDAVVLEGQVRDPQGAGVLNADIDVIDSVSGQELFTPGDNTASDGSYSVLVPMGVYDVRVKADAGSNLGWETKTGVGVSSDPTTADFDLIHLLTGVAPGSGPASGGTAVTVSGNRFDAGTSLTIGGMPLQGQNLVDPQTMTGSTGFHRTGLVDVEARYASGEWGILRGAFEFLPPAVPIQLQVGRAGDDVVLTWSDTGRPEYQASRSEGDPRFGSPVPLYRGPATATSDAGAVGRGRLDFYDIQ